MTAAVSALEGIRRDPVGFLRDVLGFEAWSRQREILESVRDHPRTAVRSAHGTGKTAVAARTVLWFLAAWPRSVVVTTAPTWTQVREQLWREIAKAHGEARGFFDGELTDTRLELAPDWFGIGLSTDRPERAQGFHAEHLLLVVDEAGGVDERMFDALEGYLTSPTSRLLMVGNPTATAGTFFRAFHADRALYNTIAVSAFDTPAFTGEQVPPRVLRRLTSRAYVETAQARWGEASPLYAVRVLGEFPRVADDAVVSLGELEAAQARSVTPGLPVVVAVDVARFGSDETVIAVRRGQHVRIAETYGGQDTMATAGRVLRVARRVAAESETRPTIVVDDVGVGGGVVDRLREIGEYTVVSFGGGERADDADEYPNRRSEAWFRFAEQLPTVDLDDDEQLAADLLAPAYMVDSAGRRVVEPKAKTKARLKRSPDRADAVLMAFSPSERGRGWSYCGVCGSESCTGDCWLPESLPAGELRAGTHPSFAAERPEPRHSGNGSYSSI